jgi:RimJ/RimL family protein N-acetyltransferase
MIRTNRLTLRIPLYTQPTLSKQVQWLNDVDVVKFSQQRHRTHTLGSQMAYIASFRPPNDFREIFLGDEIIGTISAQVDGVNSIADVGIMIGEKSKWGKGYGQEAWDVFCDALHCRKIEAGCDDRNRAMQKICLKYGMQEEGRRKSRFLSQYGVNSYSDMVMFGKVLL